MMLALQFALQLYLIYVLFLVGYLLLLTVNSLLAEKRTRLESEKPSTRFLILIPAHNEERLLPELIKNLNQLNYPNSLFRVHVVADNCTDNTAEIGRNGGVIVHERQNESLKGKGFALQWLLQRLWQAKEPHDAIVILDADSIVSSNFLQVMDARLVRCERVIQAYYAVRNPAQSWSVSLRYVALAVLHYLRPLGRMILGGSAGLKGNGMVFANDVLKQHEWSESITEDIEFHMNLILNGERVMFAPDAVVEAEMPQSLAGSQTQNVRWEQGRLQMARRYVPRLFKEAIQSIKQGQFSRSFLFFDALMEHIIPPFSILASLSFIGVISAIIFYFTAQDSAGSIKIINIWLGVGGVLGQIIYITVGLWLVRAPKKVFKALLYAPLFIAWKIWLYLKILIGKGQQGWVRTVRNET